MKRHTTLNSFVDVNPVDGINDGMDCGKPLIYNTGDCPIVNRVDFYALNADPTATYHVLARDFQLQTVFEGTLVPIPCPDIVGTIYKCFSAQLAECSQGINFPDEIKFHPDYNFIFEVHTGNLLPSPDGCPIYDTPVAASGISTNKVYVMRNGAATANGQLPWETVCELSCIGCDEEYTRDDALYALAEHIQAGSITRKARDGFWKADGALLTYWGQEPHNVSLAADALYGTPGLLIQEAHDPSGTVTGTCGAWASLFTACARVQNIKTQPVQLGYDAKILSGVYVSPAVYGAGFYKANHFAVNNLVFNDPEDPGQPHHDYFPLSVATFGLPNSSRQQGLEYSDGIDGQSNPNPQQMHVNHAQICFTVMRPNGKTLVLFDPSYQTLDPVLVPTFGHDVANVALTGAGGLSYAWDQISIGALAHHPEQNSTVDFRAVSRAQVMAPPASLTRLTNAFYYIPVPNQ